MNALDDYLQEADEDERRYSEDEDSGDPEDASYEDEA